MGLYPKTALPPGAQSGPGSACSPLAVQTLRGGGQGRLPEDVRRSLSHFWHQLGCRRFPLLPSTEGTRQPWVRSQGWSWWTPGCSPADPFRQLCPALLWVGLPGGTGRYRKAGRLEARSQGAEAVLREAWLIGDWEREKTEAGESEPLGAPGPGPSPCPALPRLVPSTPQHHWVWPARLRGE